MQYYRTSTSRDKFMRLFSLLIVILLLPACASISKLPHEIAKLPDEIVYKLPTRQGNVIEQKQLDQLHVGMTRDQVKFLMGTPIAANPFREDRWDYFGYYKSPRGEVSRRNVTLYFDNAKLTHMEGVRLASADQAVQAKTLDDPDFDNFSKQQKQDKKDNADRARDENPAGVPGTPGALPSPTTSSIPVTPP
ncbi:MAG: outer membrane protein assembly factor BamE [Nevskia sp.]|nr:outer membrane protein assembly factor BamE [Nevskia sp.]